MIDTNILLSTIGGLLGLANVWFWYDKKRTDASIGALDKEINGLTKELNTIVTKQQHFATHSEVRELIRESIEPLKQDQRDTISLAREINATVNQLAREIAVLNALRGAEYGNKNTNN